MQLKVQWRSLLAGGLVAASLLVPGTAFASGTAASAAGTSAPVAAAPQATVAASSAGTATVTVGQLSTAPDVLATTFGQRVVSTALNYLGVPYRFGATGPSAFDCSGFVQYVFRKNGVTLPRISYQQARVGTFVPKSQLQPGDIVFFQNTWRGGIDHVGIYIGNGQFVHAWPRGGVRISSLSSTYFVAHYWGAKRVQP